MTLRRRRSAPSYTKLAVSVPSELLDAMKGEMRARNAASVSAYISEAVEEKLERDRLQDMLNLVWREKPMTVKERRWADKILRG